LRTVRDMTARHQPTTANCTIMNHFSAFEFELVALFSRCRLKTAGNGSKIPKFEHRRVSKPFTIDA
jgi:hypothetical protein